MYRNKNVSAHTRSRESKEECFYRNIPVLNDLLKYTVFEVRRQSYAPDDDYLYMVAAKHQNGTYAIWTSWNESIQILNCGHYDIPDIKVCAEIITEYQNIHNFETHTPLQTLQKLLVKHNNNLEDTYQ